MKMNAIHRGTRFYVGRAFLYLILLLLAVVMLIPFVWLISSSLKLDSEVFSIPIKWIPTVPRWQNYVNIWTREDFHLDTYIANTLILTVVVTILQLLTSSFAAYSFAKLRFPGKKTLFMCYVATIAIPWQSYMLPQFIMVGKYFSLNNTLLSMVLLQAFSAFGVFMMRQFYMGVPDELCEAARIDGLSEYGIWARIMLPLSVPALSTLVIFTFVNTWNDFLGPSIYLTQDSVKTIQVGLRRLVTQYGSEYGMIFASSVVSLVPVLLIFLLLQKYFVQGIATSGIKG
ncbi:MAG: carbohydrate ABC transporter permease [Oscillospiraceae bacterium]|nr:carbohydrate ABC transporter permease [Oscillospiraceae bacterium]